mmetsp:Transcript_122837/g.392722  ORF Transcript_122837/g.392722 Transcript_122837/m.392722 type:complete len:180 (+) Transcript_122837:320-859(+)
MTRPWIPLGPVCLTARDQLLKLTCALSGKRNLKKKTGWPLFVRKQHPKEACLLGEFNRQDVLPDNEKRQLAPPPRHEQYGDNNERARMPRRASRAGGTHFGRQKTENFDIVGSTSWARVAVDVLVAVAVVVFSVVVVVVVVGHASYSLSSSPHHRHSKCTPSAKQPLLYSPGLQLLSHA